MLMSRSAAADGLAGSLVGHFRNTIAYFKACAPLRSRLCLAAPASGVLEYVSELMNLSRGRLGAWPPRTCCA